LRIEKPGLITDGLYMIGSYVYPVYLLDGKNPVIFDGGVAILSDVYIESIQAILGEREPAYCFLTHSHFDHCGAIAYFKAAFPSIKVVASTKAHDILKRPHVLKLIKELNRSVEQTLVESFDVLDRFCEFQPFEIDRYVHDDEVLELAGGLSIRAIGTPGHTIDCFSYYIPEQKILISSDATGIPKADGYIMADFLTGYDQYYRSLKKLSVLDIDVICLGHLCALTGRDVSRYIRDTTAQCEKFKDLIETSLTEENGNVKQVVQRIKKFEYDDRDGPRQPEPAYLLNLKARVTAVKNQFIKKGKALHGTAT